VERETIRTDNTEKFISVAVRRAGAGPIADIFNACVNADRGPDGAIIIDFVSEVWYKRAALAMLAMESLVGPIRPRFLPVLHEGLAVGGKLVQVEEE
jgi:hypothetical protein